MIFRDAERHPYLIDLSWGDFILEYKWRAAYMVKVSVIIPIYNCEEYLDNCIKSILCQTLKDQEIICIDDGSTDHSAQIIKKFQAEDGRIILFQQKNQGAAAARNLGLKNAKGEYIAFLDADDWVEDCFLERLVNLMECAKADVVISGCIEEKGEASNKLLNLLPSGIYAGSELIKKFFTQMLYFGDFYRFGILPYMWTKLYRKELIRKHINVDTRIYDGEDVAVVYPCLLDTKKVVVTDECMYHYRIHKGSISFEKGTGFYDNVSRLYLYLNNKFKESQYYELMLPQLNQYLRWMIWIGMTMAEREKECGFCFPFGKVACGSNIILYGAGSVGVHYYQQLKRTDYCNIISWVDRGFLELATHELLVESPKVIPMKEYDYIIIAIADTKICEEVKMYLLDMGVREAQIIMGET